MFTDKAQFIIDLSKDHAFSRGSVELTLEAMLAAVAGQAEAGVLLCECTGMERSKLKSLFPELPELMSCPTKLPLSEAVRTLLNTAKTLAAGGPDRRPPGRN